MIKPVPHCLGARHHLIGRKIRAESAFGFVPGFDGVPAAAPVRPERHPENGGGLKLLRKTRKIRVRPVRRAVMNVQQPDPGTRIQPPVFVITIAEQVNPGIFLDRTPLETVADRRNAIAPQQLQRFIHFRMGDFVPRKKTVDAEEEIRLPRIRLLDEQSELCSVNGERVITGRKSLFPFENKLSPERDKADGAVFLSGKGDQPGLRRGVSGTPFEFEPQRLGPER